MTRTPSTTSFDVVLVPFPFADLSATKKRPCLVLAAASVRSLGRFLVVAMITSNLTGLSFPHDVAISDVKAAGLPKPSLVRVDKLVTIEEKIIFKQLGMLSSADRDAVRAQFVRFFGQII